jgi:uncharacterized damage-inducible protein DinB
MTDVTALDLVRGLYAYHWWANRRLLDHAGSLGEDALQRDVGRQFSYPTVLRMFAHIYGADALWLTRWQGESPTSVPGDDIATLADLRARWADLEARQRRYLDGLTAADLGRAVDYKNTAGQPFRVPLGPLLQHVPNHATHHRSEIATMITMISGSPPDTGLALYETTRTGQ